MVIGGLKGIDNQSYGIPSLGTRVCFCFSDDIYLFSDEYLRIYTFHRSGVPLHNLNYGVAFSLFRVAGILQGVAKRAELGNASSSNAKDVGSSAKFFADEGLKIAIQSNLGFMEASSQLFPFSSRAKVP